MTIGKSEIVIYKSEDGNIKVDVLFENETVWLTQQQICELFGKSRSTISVHIKNIFDEGELQEDVVVRKIRNATHGAIGENRLTCETAAGRLAVRRKNSNFASVVVVAPTDGHTVRPGLTLFSGAAFSASSMATSL